MLTPASGHALLSQTARLVIGSVLVDTVYTPAARLLDFRLLRDSLDRAFAPEGPAPVDYVEAYACQWVSPSTVFGTLHAGGSSGRPAPRRRESRPGPSVWDGDRGELP